MPVPETAADGTTVEYDIDALAVGVAEGDRAALAKAITLVESTRTDHEKAAQTLLLLLADERRDAGPTASAGPQVGATSGATSGATQRVGITGVPGAGKSTLIATLGLQLIDAGHRVAVVTIDPSSAVSGGSILGDKTRMGALATHDAAFVRPSPSGGTLGGVARRTREAMLLCEAAGYDVVFVETVGVGQSEIVAADMVDVFIVMVLAGAGDELQGIKRGVLELADIVVVNKADGEGVARAKGAAAELRRAMRMLLPLDPDWRAPVLAISALSAEGPDELWRTVQRHRDVTTGSGSRERRRASQRVRWMWRTIDEGLLGALRRDKEIAVMVEGLEREVREGVLPPAMAALRVLEAFHARRDQMRS